MCIQFQSGSQLIIHFGGERDHVLPIEPNCVITRSDQIGSQSVGCQLDVDWFQFQVGEN